MKTKIVVTVEYEIVLCLATVDDVIGYLEHEAKLLHDRMKHPMQRFRLVNSKTKVEEVK